MPVESTKTIVRDYLRAAAFYSYDATADESPVMRWIGREVKRFCKEAHLHLPFLLRVAQSPPDMDGMDVDTNAAGEMELEEDDELFLDEDDKQQAEEEAEDELSLHASYWDNFLALVESTQREWADGDEAGDTDEYRKTRAVEAFNLGNTIASDLYALHPELAGWVFHVLCFIVPRQILALGNPARRSCDACESFGAVVKKCIRHLSCRRLVTRGDGDIRQTQKGSHRVRFTRGYIEQVFRRVSVRAELIHGKDNIPYLQRGDYRLLGKGKKGRSKMVQPTVKAPTVEASVEAPTVFTQKMHLAVWS